MIPKFYFGGNSTPHFIISKLLLKTFCAAAMLFSGMLIAQDTEPPIITSGAMGNNLVENSGANQVVYTTVATDNVAVTSYELTGNDADKLSVSNTGVVTLIANPDFETQYFYTFNVVVGDAQNNTSTQVVRFYIENDNELNLAYDNATASVSLDEGVAEVGTFAASYENNAKVRYDISGTDAHLFEIDQLTGALQFKETPVFGNPKDGDADNTYDVIVWATEVLSSLENRNIAPMAMLSTTVENWHGDATEEESLAKIVNQSNTADWDVYPEDDGAGKTITFDFPYLNTGYVPSAFKFFNRVSCCQDRIHGSTVAFNFNGVTQQEYTLNNNGTAIIELNQFNLLPFNQVVLTFAGDGKQNFREIEIEAKPSGFSVSKTVSIAINQIEDSEAPVITSGTEGINLTENTGAGQVVYNTIATDNIGIYTYILEGADADKLAISDTGVVTLTANPDYETQSSYSFSVTAQDYSQHTSNTVTVTFSIIDVDDENPVITSGDVTTSILEHSSGEQVVYTITATDNEEIAGFGIGGGDAQLFTVNTETGEVTFTGEADFETKTSYRFEVWAQDAEGNTSTKNVYVPVENDPSDDLAGERIIRQRTAAVLLGTNFLPKFTYTDSGGPDGNYGHYENSTITFLAEAGETVAVLYSNFITEGGRYDNIVVSGAANNDHNAQFGGSGVTVPTLISEVGGGLSIRFYSDSSGTRAGWVAYVVASNDGFSTPVIGSPSGTTVTIDENSGSEQVVYRAYAIDDVGVTGYVLGGADASHFTVNASSAVSLTADPDFETKESYTITLAAQDEDGHTSEPITVNVAITDVDEEPPTKPVVSFTDDGDASDGVTTDPTLTISDLEVGATLELSRDNGQNWISMGEVTAETMTFDGSKIALIEGTLSSSSTVNSMAVGNLNSLDTHSSDYPDSFYFDITLPNPLTTAQEVIFESGGDGAGVTFFIEGNDLKGSLQENNDHSDHTAEDVFEAGKRYGIIIEFAANGDVSYYVTEKISARLPISFGTPITGTDVLDTGEGSTPWSGGNDAGWGQVNHVAQGQGTNTYVSFSGTFHEGRFYNGKGYSEIWLDGVATGESTHLLDQHMATVVARQTDADDNTSEVSDAVNIQIPESLSIDTHEKDSLYYNNPVTGNLKIGSNTPIKSVVLYSVTGQKVLDVAPNKNEADVDISSLTQGIYLMKVHVGKTYKTIKLLKE